MAAGIEPHLPSAVPTLSNEVSELFGFVIREAVTNVVRHSEASQCTIDVGEHQLSVADDVQTIVVPNLLLVREDLDPNVACVLTKVLFDRKPQLEQANAAAKEISLDTARKTDPVPLHRGAVKALDDLGAPK